MIEGLVITNQLNDDDLIALAELKYEDDAEFCRNHKQGERDPNVSLGAVFNLLGDNEVYFWLARLHQNPVGYSIAAARGEVLVSQAVYVKPEFRRQGIGKELKKSQIEFARQKGLKEIGTAIPRDNNASLALSRGLGFKIEDKGVYVASLRLSQ